MSPPIRRAALCTAATLVLAAVAPPALAARQSRDGTVRFATFNASVNRNAEGRAARRRPWP